MQKRYRSKSTATASIFSFLSVVVSIQAELIFNVTGTANSSDFGYTSGNSYTFSFTVNPAFANNGSCSFSSSANFWSDETTAETPIFTDISGDGLTGTWTRPTIDSGDPYSYISNQDGGNPDLTELPDLLELFVGNDSLYSIGLQASGNAILIINVVSLDIGLTSCSFPGSFTDPSTYFNSLVGSYSANGGQISLQDTSFSIVNFNVTNVEIAQTVPEPATAMMIGMSAILIAARYRSRKERNGCLA